MAKPPAAMGCISGMYSTPTNNPKPPSSCNPPIMLRKGAKPYRLNSDFICVVIKQAPPKKRNDTAENNVR